MSYTCVITCLPIYLQQWSQKKLASLIAMLISCVNDKISFDVTGLVTPAHVDQVHLTAFIFGGIVAAHISESISLKNVCPVDTVHINRVISTSGSHCL